MLGYTKSSSNICCKRGELIERGYTVQLAPMSIYLATRNWCHIVLRIYTLYSCSWAACSHYLNRMCFAKICTLLNETVLKLYEFPKYLILFFGTKRCFSRLCNIRNVGWLYFLWVALAKNVNFVFR